MNIPLCDKHIFRGNKWDGEIGKVEKKLETLDDL
jgi:hypothetical protein